MGKIFTSYEVYHQPLDKVRAVHITSQTLRGRLGKKDLCSNVHPLEDNPFFLAEFAGESVLEPIEFLNGLKKKVLSSDFMGGIMIEGLEACSSEAYMTDYPNGQLMRRYFAPELPNKATDFWKFKDGEEARMTKWRSDFHNLLFAQYQEFVNSLGLTNYSKK